MNRLHSQSRMHALLLDPGGLWAVKIDIKSSTDRMVLGELSSMVCPYTARVSPNIPDVHSDFTRTAKFGCRKAGVGCSYEVGLRHL